mgnify:CR=1 FL=1
MPFAQFLPASSPEAIAAERSWLLPQHADATLACGLLMCVWMVKTQSQTAFTQTTTGFDAVLGARGSKLQLVLNTGKNGK